MAQGATIHRLDLSIADTERNYYAEHALRVARHPSETDERMMVRILAFALHGHRQLEFGRGLSSEDEADLRLHGDDGRALDWISVGLPDPKWLRKAAGRTERLWLYAYGHSQAIWWRKSAGMLEGLRTLTIRALPTEATAGLAAMAGRSMKLQVTVQDQLAWVDDGKTTLTVGWTSWQQPVAPD